MSRAKQGDVVPWPLLHRMGGEVSGAEIVRCSSVDDVDLHPHSMQTSINEALANIVLASVVRREHGSGSLLSKAVASGELVRLARGLYVPSADVVDMPPWHISELRARAVGLHGNTDRPLARRAAALVWGIPVIEHTLEHIDVLGWSAAATRTDGGLRYWASAETERFIETRDGIEVTSLARTVVELCARGPIEHAVAAMDWAVRTAYHLDGPRTCVAELREVGAALGSPRLAARLEKVIELSDGRSESPGESVSRVAMHFLGFARPDLQVEFTTASGRVVRCDFGWHGAAIVGEFDGETKYRSEAMLKGRTAADAVVDEKEREDDIRDGGRRVARWGWAHLEHRPRLAARLTRAGVPRR